MIKRKKLFSLLTIFILAVVSAMAVSAVPIPLGPNCGSGYDFTVEVDDIDLDPADTNRLDLERDDEFEVRITIGACGEAKDTEITAFISGYEYNDKNRISDSTHVFDAEENVTYVKKLDLRLPDNVDEDDYLLRVIISDRYDEAITEEYRLKIDVQRHSVKIDDVIFTPGSTILGGRALLTTVRVDNQGEKDEESVKVKVSIPALGLSAADYIDEIEADESESSEELYLRIPTCAEGGDYQAKVCIEYDEGYEKECKDYIITVVPEESCTVVEEETEEVVVVKTTVVAEEEPAEEEEEEEAAGSFDTIKRGLEIGLVVLVVLLVILGLIIGFSKLKGSDDEDEDKEEKTYY